MNKTWILLKVLVLNFSRINEIRKSDLKKVPSRLLTIMGIGFGLLFLGGYNMITAQTLVSFNQQELIPSYMVAVSSFAIILLTIFYSNDLLFSSRDLEGLLSLPVSSSQIIKSKFMLIYILNVSVTLLFMGPGGAIWVMHTNADSLWKILYFLAIFFVPFIPMCLASIMGIMIVSAASHVKNKMLASLLLSIAMLVAIVGIGIYSMQQTSELTDAGAILARQIIRLYPVAILFTQNTNVLDHIALVGFILLSLGTFFLFIKVVSRNYSKLYALSKPTTTKRQREVKNIRKQPVFALYQKEWARFLSSYLTVLNTGLGIIMLVVLSLALLLMPLEQLGGYIGVTNVGDFLASYAPSIIASMFCLSCTTAYSISLEGKNSWIVQSSPVTVKQVIDSKVAVNETLHFFGYTAVVLAITIKVNLNLFQLGNLIVSPLAYSIFICVLGIFLNKKHPNFNWDSEMMVVKQSMPVLLTSGIGLLTALLPVALHWFFSLSVLLASFGVSIVIVGIAIKLYHTMCKENYI